MHLFTAEQVASMMATERERWRALLSDARQWLGVAPDSLEALAEVNALLRRVADACSLWHDNGPNVALRRAARPGRSEPA